MKCAFRSEELNVTILEDVVRKSGNEMRVWRKLEKIWVRSEISK